MIDEKCVHIYYQIELYQASKFYAALSEYFLGYDCGHLRQLTQAFALVHE